MSKHIEVRIYIKFNSKNTKRNKKYNKDLIKYIKSRIDIFNNCGNFIDLILCDENNDKCLSELNHNYGIKRLPALIMVGNKEKIYGTPDIKKIVGSLCKKRPTAAPKKNEEIVHDYQMQLIGGGSSGNIMHEDESPYETSFDDLARATVETQRRLNQYNQHDMNSAKGRRNLRNSKKPMSHRGKLGEPYSRRNGPIFSDSNNYEDENFDENIENRGQKKLSGERGRLKIRDDPAAIQRSLGNDQDNDLMAQFWDNNTETK